MERKLKNHLVGLGKLKDWKAYENYDDSTYLGGAMSEIRYSAYADTPSKGECDKLCEEHSGEVIIYKIKPTKKL
ncbi:hypothetical protein NSQ77_20030 [Oceanobacillus sp. FSL K6-2867]|uniref:hypothetical protein n=1 Tax=Oceanobacillus sp. FSL K6-2867 TaxID=2954748 RepID=UPI0030D9A9FE